MGQSLSIYSSPLYAQHSIASYEFKIVECMRQGPYEYLVWKADILQHNISSSARSNDDKQQKNNSNNVNCNLSFFVTFKIILYLPTMTITTTTRKQRRQQCWTTKNHKEKNKNNTDYNQVASRQTTDSFDIMVYETNNNKLFLLRLLLIPSLTIEIVCC